MKLLKVAVVMALVVLMAAPAFAEMKLNGYYRLQGTFFDDGTGADDNQDFSQRLRMKLTNTLNENVSFVYYGEVDADWGQPAKGTHAHDTDGNPDTVDMTTYTNGGGTVAGDGVNLETKNVYLAIKGDNFSTKLGLQGMGDTFDGLIFSEDMAGATFKTSVGPADFTLLYSKLVEGAKDVDDDATLYGGTVSFAASDMATFGASVYYTETEAAVGSDADVLYYGVNGSVAVSEALSFNAFGFVADMDNGVTSGDTYILNADARYKFDMGNAKFRVMYAPEEDQAEDQFMDIAEAGLNGEGLMFIGGDAYATNNGNGEDKYTDALYSGAGLMLYALSGQLNFDNDIYARFALAYADTDDDDLGTEVGATIGKKFFGNVDVSVRAAQFMVGDAYGPDANDMTKVIGMVNVGF